jgi:hypothetical protein
MKPKLGLLAQDGLIRKKQNTIMQTNKKNLFVPSLILYNDTSALFNFNHPLSEKQAIEFNRQRNIILKSLQKEFKEKYFDQMKLLSEQLKKAI